MLDLKLQSVTRLAGLILAVFTKVTLSSYYLEKPRLMRGFFMPIISYNVNVAC